MAEGQDLNSTKHFESLTLAVTIVRDSKCLVQNKLIRVQDPAETFDTLFNRVKEGLGMDIDVNTHAIKIKCSSALESSSSTSSTFEVELADEVGMITEFGCKHVTIHCDRQSEGMPETEPVGKDAFSELMGNRGTTMRPNEIAELSNKHRLQNALIRAEPSMTFPHYMSTEEVTKQVGVITNSLWYLDGRKNTLKDYYLNTKLPERFEPGKLDGYQNWKKNKQKPRHDQQTVATLSTNLWGVLEKPFVKSWDSGLVSDLQTVAVLFQELADALEKKKQKMQDVHNALHPARQIAEDASLTHFPAVYPMAPQYAELDQAMQGLEEYEPVALTDIVDDSTSSFQNRTQWFRFYNNIGLSVPVDMLRFDPGGGTGILLFLWRTPKQRSENEILTMSARCLAKLRPQLPEYHTRAMRKSFKNDMSKLSTSTPSYVVRQIYKQLTLDATKDQNPALDERIKIALSLEEPDMLFDLRHLNSGRPSGTFEVFFQELESVIEQWTAADERRHGIAHMSQFLSVPDLIEQVKASLPENTPIPSESTVLLSFAPPNSCTLAARHYTGRIKLTHKVQSRQLRNVHLDFHFCSAQFKYLREMVVKFAEQCVLLSADDKAKIPVGEPGLAVASGVRGRQSIVPTNITVAALDHDVDQKALVVPSVLLDINIPSSSSQSFYQGQVTVSLKDAVFQASSPNRFVSELVNYIRSKDKTPSLLFLVTDGGPEHRNTFESVKLSLVHVFQVLNLDMLIAIRLAPGQSFSNPVERIMSILNIALQNVALNREAAPEEIENILKSCSGLHTIRDKGLSVKEAWIDSIQPVLVTLQDRFRRCSLKGIPFEIMPPCTLTDMQAVEETIRKIDPSIDPQKLQKQHLSRKGAYNSYMDNHCRARQYSFQVRKCDDRQCCPEPKISNSELHWLPDPVLSDEGTHYKPFDAVYGTEQTTDDDRGSVRFSTQRMTAEEQGCPTAMLTGQNVRKIAYCKECNKPRCIYKKTALTPREGNSVKRILNQCDFVCGSIITPEDHPLEGIVFSRLGISCASPVEWAFYSSTSGNYSVCCHCGGIDGAVEVSLKQLYKTVLPVCPNCKEKGLKAITRNPIRKKRN